MNKIAVCICTYKRPDGLAKLLESLTQLSPLTPDDIIIVDNHADAEGVAVCERLNADYPFNLHYVAHATPGISYARNKAVSMALALQPDYIGFLDDDEWPDPAWLTELIRVCDASKAAVVGGPTLPVFPPDSPRELTNNPYYGADLNIADGEKCQLQAAGNFLIKASVIAKMGPEYFRHEFAESGGEDLAFFTSLTKQNVPMSWAAKAIVHEAVPHSRLGAGWLKARIVNIANSRVRVMQILEPGLLPAVIRGLKTVALFIQAMIWSALGIFSKSLRQQAAMLRWKCWGKLTAHLRYKTVRGEGH